LFFLAAPAAAAERPNVIVILADDLGYGDLGCYNPSSKVPTPHLDRLAREGLRFTDMHSPSGVCTPTRYGILTGRYAWRTRLKRGVLLGRSPNLIEPERLTLAEILRDAGYATAAVGKWHLGFGTREEVDYAQPLVPGPNTHGFEYFFGIPSSLDFEPYVFVENERVVELPTATVAASKSQREGGGGFWRGGAIAPSFRHEDVLPRLTRRAVEVVEKLAKEAKEKDAKPFFLYLPLSAPHTPWLPAKEFEGRSGAGPYGDFVMQTDAAVGEVLAALDRTDASERTLVIATSDNGAHWAAEDIAKYGHRANGELRGQKGDAYEGGHRVPFLVRWPGKVAAGGTSAVPACLTDIMATLAAVVQKPLPDDAAEDSFDLSAAIFGRAGPTREAIVHHTSDGVFAVRQGDWKLILGLGSGGFTAPRHVQPGPGEPAGQLYDLRSDPGEARNLYAERPDVVAKLKNALEVIQAEGRSRPRMPRKAAGDPNSRR
jgi:arylsulfatase A-like enzyme